MRTSCAPAALALVGALAGTSGARAQAWGASPTAEAGRSSAVLDPRVKEEARQRFDRGLTLYNQGDAMGALAEFELAHELTGHPMVLFNLALVRARLGHSVQAAEALEALRGFPISELAPGTMDRAQALYESQLARVGWLEIKSSTPRAVVQIDNVDVARTPAPPIRLTAGVHFVSVAAAAHEPRHLQVTVAGRAREILEVELTPLEVAPAQLTVTSNVPGATVLVDGTPLGRTPLPQPVTLSAGAHELELRRAGYAPVRQRLQLSAGGSARLAAKMSPTQAGLRDSGILALRLSEPGAVVSVDGEPHARAAGGVRLPLGLHSVRVQRAGFFDIVRDVEVKHGEQTLDASLLPTPEYLSDYVSRARSRRTWSYIALGAGGAVAAGAGGFLIWNQGQKNEARRRFDEYADAAEQKGGCPDDACETSLNIYAADLDAKQGRDIYGWLGVGAGALGVTAGLLLYGLGDDPARYEPKPASDVFGSLDVRLTGRAVELNGRF
ncbi:MAG: PEGA domain-containing protein [Myxococcales bacterium]|nr:MAG: PEGA domain-containing protein [Myxococcales bacterium]